VAGEAEKLYAAWLAPDVVAFASDPTDRAPLERLIGGKGGFAAQQSTRKAIATVAPGTMAWGVYATGESLGAYQMKYGSASLAIAGGQLTLDVSVVLADADQARKAAADWTAELQQLLGGAGNLPPVMMTLLKAVTIAASDDAVHVTAVAAEKDLVAIFSLF
jgi:hypothetical protein